MDFKVLELLARFELATSSLPRSEGLRPSKHALPTVENTRFLPNYAKSQFLLLENGLHPLYCHYKTRSVHETRG